MDGVAHRGSARGRAPCPCGAGDLAAAADALRLCRTALWPLIGAVLALRQCAEAIDCVRRLLAPTQMRLPDSIADTLGQAVQAWEGGNAEEAHAHLAHALSLAHLRHFRRLHLDSKVYDQ